MSTFIESEHSRNPQSGRFEDKAGAKPGGSLATPVEEYRVAGVSIASSDLEPLPAWPEGIPKPTTECWFLDDGSTETLLQFGDASITVWHNDDFDGPEFEWIQDRLPDDVHYSDAELTRTAIEKYACAAQTRSNQVVRIIEGALAESVAAQVADLVAGGNPSTAVWRPEIARA